MKPSPTVMEMSRTLYRKSWYGLSRYQQKQVLAALREHRATLERLPIERTDHATNE